MSRVRAVHTFAAEHGDELDFQAGDIIDVLERDEGFGDGWWRGRNARGEEGLFPATYIEEMESEKAAPENAEVPGDPVPNGGPDATAVVETGAMGQTLASIQNAIESMGKPSNEDIGVPQDTRARLAAQAKLANDTREKQRTSGGVTGLIYSDESDDDDDDEDPAPGETPSPAAAAASASALTPAPAPASAPSPAPASSGALQPPPSLPATPSTDRSTPSTWSVDDVVKWAASKGFDQGICEKFREHEISGDLLLELDANLLKELDIPQFGKRLKIAQAINELRPVPIGLGASPLQRGMSAPPTATSPSLSPDIDSNGWNRRSGSGSMGPPTSMGPIYEGRPHSPQTSVPTSPMTPNSASMSKRESTGSMGHKKKASLDNKDRLSFFSRNRKPAPAASPGDTRVSRPGNRTHQIQPATPQFPSGALRQIGPPDHSGYMRKKGERYATWKTRFFVLKGAHLYYMKNEHEDRVKGHIDLRGYRVIMDENANPGSYGFRLVGKEPHVFSSTEQSTVREWMKALIKATIARDYNVPVTSSCNIPTIPLAEAQALSPRPPSPATREATQRATRRENTSQLTAHDASVLMSLDTKRASLIPSRPSRDGRPTSARRQELVEWVNNLLPPPYPKAASLPESFVSGEVIFLLVRHLSGIEPTPPVPPNAFAPVDGLPGIDGLFAMMDILIDAGIDTVGVSINDVRNGEGGAIARLLESIREWHGQRA